METQAHARLKQLSVRVLRSWGGQAVAEEVRCPLARYRVDAAGYVDRQPPDSIDWSRPGRPGRRDRVRPEPKTVLLECKQSRADFLRDRNDLDRLTRYRDRLHGMRRSLERTQLVTHEPHLRQAGSSLFADLDDWEFTKSRHRGYRRVLRKLKHVDELIHGGTKFCLMARYRVADYLYLVTPEGLVRPREVPPGWGLLECSPEWLKQKETPSLFEGPWLPRIAKPAADLQCREAIRLRLLRNIAVAASWQAHADPIWARRSRGGRPGRSDHQPGSTVDNPGSATVASVQNVIQRKCVGVE